MEDLTGATELQPDERASLLSLLVTIDGAQVEIAQMLAARPTPAVAAELRASLAACRQEALDVAEMLGIDARITRPAAGSA